MYKGVWHRTESEDLEVAVKSLKKEANEKEKVLFLQEAAIMGQFHHPYIVQVFGVLLAKECSIIGEFMNRGSLLHYLRNLQPRYKRNCVLL